VATAALFRNGARATNRAVRPCNNTPDHGNHVGGAALMASHATGAGHSSPQSTTGRLEGNRAPFEPAKLPMRDRAETQWPSVGTLFANALTKHGDHARHLVSEPTAASAERRGATLTPKQRRTLYAPPKAR
jgi:hypothetical protein